MSASLQLLPVTGVPLVQQGDDVAALLLAAMDAGGQRLQSGDVLVVAQKIISKAEGRLVQMDTVTPSAEAEALAAETHKDPRLVELILSEAVEVVRKRTGGPGVIVVEHRRGWVHANAGIDQSNVSAGDPGATALLLPEDPDASARQLRDAIAAQRGVHAGVVISDSAGRAWRVGTVGIALGAAGITCVDDLRGNSDLFGRTMEITVVGRADEIAAAAGLVMGQGAEAIPAVIVRGLPAEDSTQTAADLIRARHEDLFR